MTRYFKVTHRAGAYIDDVYYPPVNDGADISQSIVPLELAEGAKPPMWGIECDQDGNEIGLPPVVVDVQEKISTELANKIASSAGQKTLEPTKEDAQRKQTILEALQLLEHDNDAHWTARKQPNTEMLKQITGLDVTRAEVDAIAPDFVRQTPAKTE